MAVKLGIEPLFEADFLPCSYGFRPKRHATQALEVIREAGNRGYEFVVDADIQRYFDSIDQQKLLALLVERISDRRGGKRTTEERRGGGVGGGAGGGAPARPPHSAT